MSHRFHPDPNRTDDFPDSVLFDDCADCDGKAKVPMYNLDRASIHKLWRMCLLTISGGLPNDVTYNDMTAIRELRKVYIFLQNYTTTDPNTLEFKPLDF